MVLSVIIRDGLECCSNSHKSFIYKYLQKTLQDLSCGVFLLKDFEVNSDIY